MTTIPALEELRYVVAADVYASDRRVGTLSRRGGDDVAFGYDDAYLADPSARPVAWSLPLSSELTVATGGSVPAFFAGLLPEGVRLGAVVRAARTSPDDHLTLLLAVGQDLVGDVRIMPAGTPPAEPAVVFDEARADNLDLSRLYDDLVNPGSVAGDRSALPGVQPKVSAVRLTTPVRTAGGAAILKLNPPSGYPHLVENEAFCMGLARACGLLTADVRLVHDRRGQAGLLVARFDRPTPGRRVPQEDACQVLGLYPASKYRLSIEQVVRGLARCVELGEGSVPLATRRLLELTAFSYVVGNGDLHGKNASVRLGAGDAWEVTPVYDVVCTQPYLRWRDPMALPLYGRANRLRRTHFVEAAERLGLPARAISRSLERILNGVRDGAGGAAAIGFDDRTTQRMVDLMTARAEAIATG